MMIEARTKLLEDRASEILFIFLGLVQLNLALAASDFSDSFNEANVPLVELNPSPIELGYSQISNSIENNPYGYPGRDGLTSVPSFDPRNEYYMYPNTGDTDWYRWRRGDARIGGKIEEWYNGCIAGFYYPLWYAPWFTSREVASIPYRGGILFHMSPSYAAQNDQYADMTVYIYPPSSCYLKDIRIWIHNPQTKWWDLLYPGKGNLENNAIKIPKISRNYLKEYPWNRVDPLKLCYTINNCFYVTIAIENAAKSRCPDRLIVTGVCYGRKIGG